MCTRSSNMLVLLGEFIKFAQRFETEYLGYGDFIPIIARNCSKITNCSVVVGANRDQMGMKPRQKVSGPSVVAILTMQSKALLYNLASAGWFIRRVRTMSKGETVTVIKNPAVTADKNCAEREVLGRPVICTTYPLA